MLHAEIEVRRGQPDPSCSDIPSMLLKARDQQGEPLSDVKLRDELMTLLMAGHETTATALSWALHWVLRNPHVVQRLLAEFEAAGDDADHAAIARLPYLQAVCCETRRNYPVSMVTFARGTRDGHLDGDGGEAPLSPRDREAPALPNGGPPVAAFTNRNPLCNMCSRPVR